MSGSASVIPFGMCQRGCGLETGISKKLVVSRFIRGHGGRGANNYAWAGGHKRHANGYLLTLIPGHPRADVKGYVFDHILVAEKALGKPIPKGSDVHHVNEIKSDNANTNLVVCQDRAYHFLLHQRARALRECGNPNWRKCRYCKKHEDPSLLVIWQTPPDGSIRHVRHEHPHHKSCRNQYERSRKLKRKMEKENGR